MKGYISFVLAFALAAVMLSSYISTVAVSRPMDNSPLLIEKRFYAVSDIQYSMYQQAQSAFSEAKKTDQPKDLVLDAAAIAFPEEEVAQEVAGELSASDDRLDTTVSYVYLKMVENSARLSGKYKDYDIVFWCGSMGINDKQQLLADMASQKKALACQNCQPITNPSCRDFMMVEKDADQWRLVKINPSSPFSVLPSGSYNGIFTSTMPDEIAQSGFGFSAYDNSTNQASAHFIDRIYEVKG